MAWSPADGNLIVSLRSQDWVIKINYANGTGDGHVIWTAGADGSFTLPSGTDPLAWFSHQHDVTYINNTTILVFDDGNTRESDEPECSEPRAGMGPQRADDDRDPGGQFQPGQLLVCPRQAQILPNGNLTYDSGILGSSPLLRLVD